MSSMKTDVLVQKGMNSLIDTLGVVDAERFIVFLNREKPNYDTWREKYFGKMSRKEYEKKLFNFTKKHVDY